MFVSTTNQHEHNAGSMLVHRRRRRRLPTPIQYWVVLHSDVSVSTEHTLQPVQCWLNVGPASPALASINSIAGMASCWLGAHDYNVSCRAMHDTPTQCRLNVDPPPVTALYRWCNPDQHCITAHIHQDEDIICVKAAHLPTQGSLFPRS